MTMDSSIEPAALVTSTGGMRLVLTAGLTPVAGIDRFQPAGFPEIGHVIYDAPRADHQVEPVCIVDSSASMANHLESVCLRSPYDPTPVDELSRLPYLRCVTGPPKGPHEVVRTSMTEGHRIASDYFLDGKRANGDRLAGRTFRDELREECAIKDLGERSHPLPESWWATFRAIFRYDPNALVHGVFFPKWQVKVARVLSGHHEAFGAARVDRSGVKFDRLGKTTSGQPIFAVDDTTASELRATFVLDLALLRSFGRDDFGLGGPEKQALAALALWKVGRLLNHPFRYRSGCDLECADLKAHVDGDEVHAAPADLGSIEIDHHLRRATEAVAERDGSVPGVVDLYWPPEELYREAKSAPAGVQDGDDEEAEGA